MKFKLSHLLWWTMYAAVMAAVAGAMFQARRNVVAVYGTTQAQAEWDDWRDDAKKMSSSAGPVKRREPKSPQPPALVLMRDHFAACLGLSLVLTSVLFGTLMILIRGALTTPALRPSSPDPPAAP